MRIGIPRELPPETRVACVPEVLIKMVKIGMDVLVESGAGEQAFFSDQAYEKAGAKIVARSELYAQSDIILKVNRPHLEEVDLFHEHMILIAPLVAHQSQTLLEKLAHRKVTAFSLDQLPRLARTQTMDILSSMSSIAGYKSIILAAAHSGKLFPLMTTAAGTIQPAKVIIIGAGVAGLQAIATARRLGAVVLAFDTRPAAGEQVKSLGADFVSLEIAEEEAQDKGGYAKAQSGAFYHKEQERIRSYLKEADIVVTTALVPGKPAPLLITEDMVKTMKPGAVLVDLAVEQGGNCALSEPGKITNKEGITLIALHNLPSTLPIHASQLYARNLFAFLNYLRPQIEKNEFDMSDEIVKSSLLLHQGKAIHPLLKQTWQQPQEVSNL